MSDSCAVSATEKLLDIFHTTGTVSKYRTMLLRMGLLTQVISACQLWLPPIQFSLEAPPLSALKAAATAADGAPLSSYRGSTADGESLLPCGFWFVSRKVTSIGRGGTAFAKAADALERCAFFEHDWLTAHSDKTSGTLVVCSRQLFCIWLTNANRLLQGSSGDRLRSIRWGTTVRHVLAGEERLEVRWDASTDEVTFEVLSFSRPRHPLAWATYPLVILQQRRFSRDATALMRGVTQEPHTEAYNSG